jgi:hypothetical protein
MKMTLEIEDKIVNLNLNEYKNCVIIAKELGFTVSTIAMVFKKHGLKTKNNKRNKIVQEPYLREKK